MKYIQVIDGADNCAYSICTATDDDFKMLFPADGQDVEFIEDVEARIGDEATGLLVMRTTTIRADKKCFPGISGTLFFGLEHKKRFYPNKRESDFDLGYSELCRIAERKEREKDKNKKKK